MTSKAVEIYQSQDNIFADLDLPNAGIHMLKAQLVAELYRLSAGRKLNQTQAGKLMGLSQPEVSRLFKGNFREYSVERLMGFLTSFDQDVEIVARARPANETRGQITFRMASA